MKYPISRASSTCGDSELPCTDAFQDGNDDYGNVRWAIEIDTLADLRELIKEVGKIVIDKENSILIYDDYIE